MGYILIPITFVLIPIIRDKQTTSNKFDNKFNTFPITFETFFLQYHDVEHSECV